MDLFWAIVIIASLVILLFAVIPSILESPYAPSSYSSGQHMHASVPNDASAVDKAMLDAHYTPARAQVPEDYPRLDVGSCPYTKPPATDLPLPDLPMCVAQRSNTMKLV